MDLYSQCLWCQPFKNRAFIWNVKYATFILHLATCEHPLPELSSTETNYSVPKVSGFDAIVIEGKTITFSCPPGLELTGSDSAICNQNGEWEPDLSGLICTNSISQGYHSSGCTGGGEGIKGLGTWPYGG